MTHRGPDAREPTSPDRASLSRDRKLQTPTRKPCPGYAPISSYGFLSDGRTSALVSVGGSVDWMCTPRFDGPSVFGRILDKDRGGFFTIRPSSPGGTSLRQYVADTNVLETTWRSRDGTIVVYDFLSLEAEGPHGPGEVYEHGDLVRLIECREGDVALEARIAPRPDYGRAEPRFRRARYGWTIEGGGQRLNLRTDQSLEQQGDDLVSRFRLRTGEAAVFAVKYTGADPKRDYGPEAARHALALTCRSWRTWAQRCRYEGDYRGQVLRSALVLKGLVYHDSGALLAAPTTSLPETPGGERNWDYRYMWFRDAGLMLLALYRMGYDHEAHDFMEFMIEQCVVCGEELQVMTGIGGELDLEEATLDHLEGYACSRPVRIGNGAHGQLQLDTYGEVLDAAWLYHRMTSGLSEGRFDFLRGLVDFVARNWQRPDNGVWEVRGPLQHFTHSKVMSWVALDRGVRLARALGEEADAERWLPLRDGIKEDVLAHGYDRRRGAFVQAYGSEALDASVLRLSHVGFLDGDDPRMLATIDRVRQELEVEGLVYRYRVEQTDDGLAGHEGAFGICSFWLVSSLALAGRVEEARELLESLLAHANDLGLYAEELSPEGELLGNFPQAFTHLSLIQAAANCDAAREGGEGLRAWASREAWR